MTAPPSSPYLAPGFYDEALAKGRHRDIVGGRWDETGRVQMRILRDVGLRPGHRLLDIGCGSLRLGIKAVPFLDKGNYWGTDASAALMRRGWDIELHDKARLPLSHLIEDSGFNFPGVPPEIDLAIAFGLFPHLPPEALDHALAAVRDRFPQLTAFLFTVFLAEADGPCRQPDGVVTHPDRPPRHRRRADVARAVAAAGFDAAVADTVLPRGQVLWVARPV